MDEPTSLFEGGNAALSLENDTAMGHWGTAEPVGRLKSDPAGNKQSPRKQNRGLFGLVLGIIKVQRPGSL